jgi:hypothetical protein
MTILHYVSPPAGESAIVGKEPTWPNGVPTTEYNKQLMRGLNWHNYVSSEKNHRKFVEEWIRAYKDKTDVKRIKDVPDSEFIPTLCSLMRMQIQGFPLSDHHLSAANEFYERLLAYTPPKKVKTDAAVKSMPTIQDRLKRVQEDANEAYGQILDAVSLSLEGESMDLNALRGQVFSDKFKTNNYKFLVDRAQRSLTELQGVVEKTDEQLVEGYRCFTTKNIKKTVAWLEPMVTELRKRVQAERINKVVKKRQVDKAKLAAKLRFTSSTDPVLTSLANESVVGATSLWFYDTKTRKLGFYEAEVANGIFVSGPMIRGHKKSAQKILRSPQEQLIEFMKLRKHGKRMEWFDTLTTKATVELTGRTVDTMVLLKVDA